MAKKLDFDNRPDFDWSKPLKSPDIKEVAEQNHGWQGDRNEQYRIGVGIKEKVQRGEALTPKERGMALVLGITGDRVVSFTHHGDWALRHYGLTTSEARKNPTKHAQVYVDFYNDFGVDLITACASDCAILETEALGMPVKTYENGVDQSGGTIIKDEKDVWKLREYIETTDLRKAGRMPERMEMFRELRRLSNDTAFLLPQVGSPFLLAWFLAGYGTLVKWMRKKPHLLHLFLDVCKLACFKFIDAWKEVGVHAVVESVSSSWMPHLHEWQAQEFIIPYTAQVTGYAWPFPCFGYAWGAPYAIGTDTRKYDRKNMGSEDEWIRWQMRDIMNTNSPVFYNLASDCDMPPGNNLSRYRDLALYFKRAYKVGIHGEELLSGTPEFITRKMVTWLLEMYPCEGGACIRANFIDINTSPENILAWTNALKEYGTFPMDRSKMEAYLKDHPGPTICYELKGLEGKLLKKAQEKNLVE